MNDAREVAAAMPATSPSPLLARLVARDVRIRFAVREEEFASRIHELALAACRESGRTPEEHAAHLCLDDLYLATACLRNDQRAWQELAGAHFEFMRTFARRFLPPAAARDTADEVIADLWTRGRLGKYAGKSTLRTWLGAVVAHAALNARKTMARVVPLEAGKDAARVEAPLPAAGDPANDEAAALLQQIFGRAVRKLGTEDRVLLQLYYEQGLTLEALSATLGVSCAAASRRLKAAREELRAEMEGLCRRRAGESTEALRAGLDLAHIELDLARLLGNDASREHEPVV